MEKDTMPKIVAAASQIKSMQENNGIIFLSVMIFIGILLLSFDIHTKAFAVLGILFSGYHYWKIRKEIDRIRKKYDI